MRITNHEVLAGAGEGHLCRLFSLAVLFQEQRIGIASHHQIREFLTSPRKLFHQGFELGVVRATGQPLLSRDFLEHHGAGANQSVPTALYLRWTQGQRAGNGGFLLEIENSF